jgi:HNH endonuclease
MGRVSAEYRAYLTSPHWKSLRREKILSVGRKCEVCGFDRRVQVHHIVYRSLFDVTLEDLVVLCNRCHKLAHRAQRKSRRIRTLKDPWEKWKLTLASMLKMRQRHAKRKARSQTSIEWSITKEENAILAKCPWV